MTADFNVTTITNLLSSTATLISAVLQFIYDVIVGNIAIFLGIVVAIAILMLVTGVFASLATMITRLLGGILSNFGGKK